ncbi:Hemolysin, contains CBS domains [Treponema berlinense]|uniref:Hemolysin, contains CBS domains n=1 Tax=Treponema berlinense TaxID=225004 RepID=A0A1T4Q225_9SPIR|nr:hemolysin family protein [Treponema berlinense]SJZ97833.1 Hemolysin, contains CBS domains [Treponema berlinense]
MDDYPSDNLIILLLIAITCIVLSSLFSASESAFLGLNKLRVHFLREKGDKRAIRAGKLLERKEELLNMLLVGNEIVNVTLSVVLTSIFLKLFGAAGLGIATSIATVLLLIFGEITPKSLTTRYPEKSSFFLSRFVWFFFYFLRPFVIVFTSISRLFLKIFGISTKKKQATFTEEEIKTFIDVGGEEGVLENGEKNMMNRVFKFTDLNATDIMVPRCDVIGIETKASYRDIIQLSERTRISRFPVYTEDGIDNILGVLYVKDLLFFRGAKEDFSVEKLMRPPLFIPGTTKMSSIQEMMRKNKQSFAVVIDEYSGTDGILTTEDIEREIFGAIADDFQKAGDPTSVHIKNPDDNLLDGSARLIDLADELHLKLESRDNETIGGYICEVLGHIPVPGEFIEVGEYRFEVSSMDRLRIASVHCTKIPGGEE